MKGYNHHKDQSTGETNNEQKFPNKEINILWKSFQSYHKLNAVFTNAAMLEY